MPRCDGRAAGPGKTLPCPDNRCDDTVRGRQGELMLCDACTEARFPSSGSGNSDSTTSGAASGHITTDDGRAVQNELLCFMQQRGKVLAFDDIVTICVNFFLPKEVEAARVTLESFATDKKRLPRHKGNDRDKCRKTLIDMLKICLDPSCHIPQFYAMDITRLPPVGIDHVDISALLQELVALRQGVQLVTQLQSELNTLKSLLTEHISTGSSYQHTSQSNINMTAPGASTLIDYPPLPGSSTTSGQAQPLTTTALMPLSTSQVLQNSMQSGVLENSAKQPAKKKNRVLIAGKSTSCKLKTVPICKSVEIFVSRLAPDTECMDLCENVKHIASVNGIQVDSVNSVKLPSKFNSYSSFHVTACVDASLFHDAIAMFLSGDSWPSGSIVRRFFIKRQPLQDALPTEST